VSHPKYWMHETTGGLRVAVGNYLNRKVLSDEEIAMLRAYLKQWIMAEVGADDDVKKLRDTVDDIGSRSAIDRWLYAADQCGIDPL
jgi:hypothetical protein